MSFRLARWIIRLIVHLVARLEVHGIENAPLTETCIVACNHLGRLDAVMIYLFSDRRDVVMFVAEKYGGNAFLRWFVKALDCVFVDRFNADFTAMREVLNRLNKGCVLAMAPEGTRSPTGALIEGRSGLSYLAARSGAWVVPVGVMGTEDRNVINSLRRLRRARIQLNVGKPFRLAPVKGSEREETLNQYTEEIMCQIASLLSPEYRGFYADHPRLKELLAERVDKEKVLEVANHG